MAGEPASSRASAAARSVAVVATFALTACGGQERRDDPASPARAAAPEEVRARVARDAPSLVAYVAVEGEDRVAVLEGPRWRVRRRVAVARGPHNAAADPRGLSAAVTSPPAGRLTIFDADGRVRSVPRIDGSPHDVRYMPDGRRLWVTAEQGGRIVQLSARSGTLLRSVAVGGRPHDLAISPDGRRMWITIDGSSAIEERDARSGRLVSRADLGAAPHDLAFDPRGGEVWLSNWASGTLTVASARTGAVRARVEAGTEPHHFAFALGAVWASDNGAGTLVRIGARTRRVLGRTRVGPAPHHVAGAGRSVLVAVNGSGRVAVLSRRGRLLRSLRVGAGPHGVAVLSATRAAASARRR